jgi:hypothetical protein
LLADGAAALLSTRAGSDETDPARIAAAAYATLGSGTRSTPAGDDSALARALGQRGAQLIVGDDCGSVSAQCAPRSVAPLLGGRAAGAGTSGAGVTLYAEHGEGALARADALVARLRPQLEPAGLLVVLSPFGPAGRHVRRVYLGTIAIIGSGFERGLLRSPSTRRDGIVTLADVAPTILSIAGIEPPASMDGRPMTLAPARDTTERLLRLDEDLVHAANARSRLLRGFLVAAMVVLGGIAILLATRRHVPAIAQGLLVAVCAAPLALLVEPLVAHGGIAASAIWTAAASLGVALVITPLLGARRALALVCGATAIAVLADLALGGALASRSPISYLIAEGSRFYGIGNELMGVVTGALLVAAAITYAESTSRTVQTGTVLVLTAAAYLMASPAVGAKFGSVLVSVPAFGVVVARTGGRRLNARLVVALEAGAAAVTALVLLIDRLRPAAERSHIGAGDTGATIGRKVSAAARLLAFSIWMTALLVVAAEILVVAWRRRDDVRRVLDRHPFLRAALQGAGLAIAAAIAFNDAGVIAATFIAVQVVAALFLHIAHVGDERSPA